MRRVFIVGLCVLSAVTMAASQGQPTLQAPTFRASAVAVPVEVSVRDKARKSVVGLTAKDFIVADNGVAQEVSEISYGTRPIDVTIGLDVSASVTGEVLDALRRAVLQVMGDLKKDDRLKLLLFNSEVRRAVDFTTDVKAVENAMRRVPAETDSSLRISTVPISPR